MARKVSDSLVAAMLLYCSKARMEEKVRPDAGAAQHSRTDNPGHRYAL